MPIRIHEQNAETRGSVNFLNQSVRQFFLEKGNEPLSEIKQHLKESMLRDLYLTDLRVVGGGKAQVDLVEIGQGCQGAEPVRCYTLEVGENLKFDGRLKEPRLAQMSKETQDMVGDIQRKLSELSEGKTLR